MSDDKFYVYALFRPWNGKPCYIGKGHGNRAFWHQTSAGHNRHWNRHLQAIFNKAGKLELEVPVVILRMGLEESVAFEIEQALIKSIGREKFGGPLVNRTDGGEGISGYRHSEASNEANRQAHLTENLSPDQRERLSQAHKGKYVSPETRIKLSEAKKGKPRPLHVIEAVRRAHLGAARSVETRRKISEKMKGRIVSDETKMKMSHTHRSCQNNQSAETRQKLSQCALNQWRDSDVRHRMHLALSLGQRRRWAFQKASSLVCLPVL